MNMIRLNEIPKLIVSIVICQLVGLIGSVFTTASIPTWYVTLNKPFFTPPNWSFAPVWLTLYTLMGLAAFIVWRHSLKDRQVQRALKIFGVQLIFNAFWSVAFFGLQSPIAGLIVIIMLWIAIVVTILWFLPISKPAGLLLMPYILWVSLAAALNMAIVMLN